MLNTPGRPISFRRYVMSLTGQPNLSLTIGAFVLGLLGNILAGVIGAWVGSISGNILILLVLLLIVVGVYMYVRRLQPSVAIEECPPEGKVGVILMISPLSPMIRGTPSTDEVKRRRLEVREAERRLLETNPEQLKAADFEPLLETNLEPALRALEFHHRAGTLRQCWMIGTSDIQRAGKDPTPGSARICPLLERWFNALYPSNRVDFHYRGYEVTLRGYGEVWCKVDEIYRKSALRPASIICDITGGTKLISVGAALACIADDRTMQYMATDRDWRGEPLAEGTMAPVLVDVTPYLTFGGQGNT